MKRTALDESAALLQFNILILFYRKGNEPAPKFDFSVKVFRQSHTSRPLVNQTDFFNLVGPTILGKLHLNKLGSYFTRCLDDCIFIVRVVFFITLMMYKPCLYTGLHTLI